MNKMQKYVLIHMQNDRGDFLMIRKNRPEWQKGKWNLVGGHVEKGESYEHAAIRELKEETGLEINRLNFRGLISGNGYKIAIFSGYTEEEYEDGLTDELVSWCCINNLRQKYGNPIYNLKLIVPLLISYYGLFVVNGDSYEFQEVRFYD